MAKPFDSPSIVEHCELVSSMEHCTTSHTESTEKIRISQQDEGEDERTSRMAWVVVAVVVSISTASATMWMTASSVPSAASAYLDINLTQLNWLSNISAIINTTCSLPSALSYERLGLKKSIVLSGVLTVLGCWIRCIAIIVPKQQKYIFMTLGQVIASFGGPLIYNIAAKLVAVWFAPKDRSIANTMISIQLGMALAPLVLPQIAYSPDDIPRALIAISIFSTIVAIPAFFLPSKPIRPPSKSASEVRMSFLEGIKQLLRNPTFLWIALLASIDMGMGFSVSVLIIEAILPLGYSDQAAGVCASLVVFAGFAGGVMTGYWAGKTSQYLMLIKMFAPLVVFSYICFIFQLIPNALGVIITACLINGFFAFGIFPVMLEFCSEVTYPVPESISSCVIWSMVTAFMLVFSVMIDALRAGPDANPPNNMTNSIIAMTVVSAVGYIPVIWLDGDLKRLAVDGSQKKNSSNAWANEQVVQLNV